MIKKNRLLGWKWLNLPTEGTACVETTLRQVLGVLASDRPRNPIWLKKYRGLWEKKITSYLIVLFIKHIYYVLSFFKQGFTLVLVSSHVYLREKKKGNILF